MQRDQLYDIEISLSKHNAPCFCTGLFRSYSGKRKVVILLHILLRAKSVDALIYFLKICSPSSSQNDFGLQNL